MNHPFDINTVTQKEWETHARELVKRYGAKNGAQFEREILSILKANSTKAYEKFARKADIEILEDENIPYGLRLRLAVVAVCMTFSCKSPQEYIAFRPKLMIFCEKQFAEARP